MPEPSKEGEPKPKIIKKGSSMNCGLIPSPKDNRDYVYEKIFSSPKEKLPVKFMLSTLPIRDQGSAGTCVGFASAALQECDGILAGLDEHLAPLYIYMKAKEIDGIKGEGTHIRAALKVLQKNGVCAEDLYPYVNEGDIKKLQFPKVGPIAEKEALKNKVSGYAQLTSLYGVKNAIFNEQGVLAGVLVSDSFKNSQKGWVGRIDGFIDSYHAIFLCGWDDNLEGEYKYKDEIVKYKGAFIFKNSWGTSWGDNGFGYIPYAEFDLGSKKQPPYEFPLVDEAWTSFHIAKPNEDPLIHKRKNGIESDIAPQASEIAIVLKLNSQTMKVNDETVTLRVAPKVIDGSTMVPLRGPMTEIGAEVSFNNSTKEATLTFKPDKVKEAFEKKGVKF